MTAPFGREIQDETSGPAGPIFHPPLAMLALQYDMYCGSAILYACMSSLLQIRNERDERVEP